MAKTREKKLVITKKISRDAAEAAFAEFADADARQQQLTAKMDVEITRIREKYQDDLAKHQERKDAQMAILEAFATQNPELFVKRKSVEMAHGMLGYRTGTPKLKTMKGFTWGSVLNLVKEFLPDFVRSKEELDKEALINAREDKTVSDQFRKCGVMVDQDETFFVQPKKEEVSA